MTKSTIKIKTKKAFHMKTNDVIEEVKDYFNNKKDEDYMAFNDHPLSNAKDLLDVEKPAPWDHLRNDYDDDDIDVDIKETIKK
tara:strand:- start:4 stop:252 length:249 start_codon:yes stop_codon:yes gene_type:complete